MNKLLIVLLVLGAGGLLLYLINGNSEGLPEGVEVPDDVTPEEVEQALKEDGKRTVYGSCNAIASASTCVDYIGSMWSENNMAELNCEGAGTFSRDACPYAEFGGCQSSGGTVMELVSWVYREGPGGYDEESVPYAQAACNSLPIGTWVTPEGLL